MPNGQQRSAVWLVGVNGYKEGKGALVKLLKDSDAMVRRRACEALIRVGLRGAMVGRAQGAGVTQSGKLSQATWRLAPGTYELYCSMPGHLKRGMHTRITVR